MTVAVQAPVATGARPAGDSSGARGRINGNMDAFALLLDSLAGMPQSGAGPAAGTATPAATGPRPGQADGASRPDGSWPEGNALPSLPTTALVVPVSDTGGNDPDVPTPDGGSDPEVDAELAALSELPIRPDPIASPFAPPQTPADPMPGDTQGPADGPQVPEAAADAARDVSAAVTPDAEPDSAGEPGSPMAAGGSSAVKGPEGPLSAEPQATSGETATPGDPVSEGTPPDQGAARESSALRSGSSTAEAAPGGTPPSPAPRIEATVAPRALPAGPVPVDHVAVRIARAAQDGIDRIRIALHPEALGEVDVEMRLAQDGRVEAVVRAERPETLDLLQRDARHLVRTLQEAGLQADAGSLSFQLRSGDQQRQPGFAPPTGPSEGPSAETATAPPSPHAPAPAARGLDIRV